MNLSELIAAHRDGRSYKQMAHESGGLITANTIRGYATGYPPARIHLPYVQGLAKTLHVPDGTVAVCWDESIEELRRGTEMNRTT